MYKEDTTITVGNGMVLDEIRGFFVRSFRIPKCGI